MPENHSDQKSTSRRGRDAAVKDEKKKSLNRTKSDQGSSSHVRSDKSGKSDKRTGSHPRKSERKDDQHPKRIEHKKTEHKRSEHKRTEQHSSKQSVQRRKRSYSPRKKIQEVHYQKVDPPSSKSSGEQVGKPNVPADQAGSKQSAVDSSFQAEGKQPVTPSPETGGAGEPSLAELAFQEFAGGMGSESGGTEKGKSDKQTGTSGTGAGVSKEPQYSLDELQKQPAEKAKADSIPELDSNVYKSSGTSGATGEFGGDKEQVGREKQDKTIEKVEAVEVKADKAVEEAKKAEKEAGQAVRDAGKAEKEAGKAEQEAQVAKATAEEAKQEVEELRKDSSQVSSFGDEAAKGVEPSPFADSPEEPAQSEPPKDPFEVSIFGPSSSEESEKSSEESSGVSSEFSKPAEKIPENTFEPSESGGGKSSGASFEPSVKESSGSPEPVEPSDATFKSQSVEKPQSEKPSVEPSPFETRPPEETGAKSVSSESRPEEIPGEEIAEGEVVGAPVTEGESTAMDEPAGGFDGFMDRVQDVLSDANIGKREVFLFFGGCLFFIIFIVLAIWGVGKFIQMDEPTGKEKSTKVEISEEQLAKKKPSKEKPLDEKEKSERQPVTKVDTLSGAFLLGQEPGREEMRVDPSLTAARLVGEEVKEFRNQYVQHIAMLRELKNTLDIEVFKYLDQTRNRRNALDEYLEKLQHLERQGQEKLSEIDDRIKLLTQTFDNSAPTKEEYEQRFFEAIATLSGEESYQWLNEFIVVKRDMVEVRARYRALNRLKELYIVILEKARLKEKAIALNMEPLIKGVQVVPIEGADLNLLISEVEKLDE